VANEQTTFADAFKMADNVLHLGVRGVTDLMVMPGLINLDFADVRTVMGEMGKAMMGTGESQDEQRAIAAAEAAISNPLLDDVSMKGARGVLINICGGDDITLYEVDEAVNRIRDEVDPNANIIFGSTFDENLLGTIRVSVVATGIDAAEASDPDGLFERRPRLVAVTDKPAREKADEATPETAAEMLVAETPVAETSMAETPVAETPVAKAMAAPDPAIGPAEISPPTPAMVKTFTEAEPEKPAAAAGRVEPTLARSPDDPFIPPRPVEAPRAPVEARPPEPFAAAAMANGGQKPGEGEPLAKLDSRGPSLFERMTRTGRARDMKPEHPKAEPTPRPDPAPAQTSFVNMEPGNTSTPPDSGEGEDFLDIPAFLRRQAN
jgi:cell division protein FtsZ